MVMLVDPLGAAFAAADFEQEAVRMAGSLRRRAMS
jgi:hypothetical protein